MDIRCPMCGNPVPAQEVNVQSLVARCLTCNYVFSFDDQLPAPREREPEPLPLSRPPVPRPAGLQVTSNGEVLTLSRRWFTWAVLFLTFFCVFWDGFLLVWYAAALSAKNVQVAALLFPILHLGAGVLLTYLTVCTYVNTTTVTVTRRDLTVRHGPLPWPGNRVVPLGDIDQLYSTETRGSKGSRSYNLDAVLKTGGQLRLLSGLGDSSIALFLEQQIERWAGIEDRPVGNEIQR